MGHVRILFSIIPKKIWTYLLIILLSVSLLYLIYQRGYREGKLNCEYSEFQQREEILKEKVSNLEVQLQNYMVRLEEQDRHRQRLSNSLNTLQNEKEKIIEALDNAKNTEPVECSSLSPERYELYKQLYNTQPTHTTN